MQPSTTNEKEVHGNSTYLIPSVGCSSEAILLLETVREYVVVVVPNKSEVLPVCARITVEASSKLIAVAIRRYWCFLYIHSRRKKDCRQSEKCLVIGWFAPFVSFALNEW